MLNPDEQEAAAEFIRMMKRLQVELDDVSNKFAVFQKCAARAADHCAEHAGKLPDHQTSQLKPALSKMAETLRMFNPAFVNSGVVSDFARVIRDMELEARKGKR
jgi:hypothetical protein